VLHRIFNRKGEKMEEQKETTTEAEETEELGWHSCYECEERFNCPDAERCDGCEGGLC
jgi:hypothetical protein